MRLAGAVVHVANTVSAGLLPGHDIGLGFASIYWLSSKHEAENISCIQLCIPAGKTKYMVSAHVDTQPAGLLALAQEL